MSLEKELRSDLDAYYEQCRKKAEEEQRRQNEQVALHYPEAWAWLQQQHVEQKQREELAREQAKRARAKVLKQAKLEQEKRTRAIERVESLLRAKGVRINFNSADDWDCCCTITIEIDGELVADDESYDLNMIPAGPVSEDTVL
jgi:hypothetical protein